MALIGDVRGEKEKQDVDVLDVECVPPVTLLRCAIGDLTKGGQGENAEKPTTEDVFRYLEGKIPWLVTEAGFLYEVCLIFLSRTQAVTVCLGEALGCPFRLSAVP